MIPKSKIEEWRQIANGATPGPWSYDRDEGEIHADSRSTSDGEPWHVVPAQAEGHIKTNDGLFVALSREAVPALIEEVERLHKVIAKELSENDGLGAEYTYVRALKEEIESQAKELDRMVGEWIKAKDEANRLRNVLTALGYTRQQLESI